MSVSIPTLRGTTKQALYPYTVTVVFKTEVTVFANASEQRQATQPPLFDFVLPMTSLNSADRLTYANFQNTIIGRFNQALTATINGVTYNNMTSLSDSILQTNKTALLYDIDFRLRQVTNAGWTPPTAGTTFPVLSFGASFEQPFSKTVTFMTGVNDNEHGERFSYSYFAASIPGFPTTALSRVTADYPLINDADMATLLGFFMSQQGRFASFSFVNPFNGVTVTNTRFASDEMSIKAIAPNQWSTSLSLWQTNGS